MNIESQKEQNPREQNSSDKLALGIQHELILEFCGKDRKRAEEWIKKYSENFRKIVETNPELVWNYLQTKEEIKTLLYGETIH